MSVGRRRVLLPLAFLSVAVVFTSAGVARSQNDGSHKVWNQTLTPDQIKAALARLGIEGSDQNALEKLLGEHLQKQLPNMSPEKREALMKMALSNPQFMEMAKKMAKDKQTDPGRPPKLSDDDIAKLAKLMPGNNGKPKQPFDSKFPVDSKPPDPKLPVPPVTPDPKQDPGTPPDPRKDPPKVDTPQPIGPPPTPMDPGAPPPRRPVEEELFRPPDEPTDPRAKSLQAFAAVWERNIGPLDQTPEVKRALFDLVSGDNGLDLDLKDDKGNSIWDLLRKGDGDGLSFGDFMEGGDGNWKLPQFDFPSMRIGKWWSSSSSSTGSSSSGSWNWGGSSSRPRPGSSGGSGGLGNFGFGGSWFPVVVLGLVVLGILIWVLVKNLRQGTEEFAFVGGGLGPWPIDPRQINTREDVVKAFEYLSVLICGPSAKMWTHGTIADALSELATTHGETAVMLARLYELARYAPLDEPLTPDELIEARNLVCGLAGVSY